MSERTLEERVSALEAQLGDKTLKDHFREQAELIDRLFAYRFEEFDEKWDAKLDVRLTKLGDKLDARLAALEQSLESRIEARLEAKLEAKFDAKLKPIKGDLTIIKHAVGVILTRLT